VDTASEVSAYATKIAGATDIKAWVCWRRFKTDHLEVRLKTWTGLRHKSETLSVF
jgi:hypothetical protein